jgi:hypothetical protein
MYSFRDIPRSPLALQHSAPVLASPAKVRLPTAFYCIWGRVGDVADQLTAAPRSVPQAAPPMGYRVHENRNSQTLPRESSAPRHVCVRQADLRAVGNSADQDLYVNLYLCTTVPHVLQPFARKKNMYWVPWTTATSTY